MATLVQRLTVEEFAALPERETEFCELQHGKIVRLPPPKQRHFIVREQILAALHFARSHGMLAAEFPFQCGRDDVREADIGFMLAARMSPADDYPQGAPDLTVEIMSPANAISEMRERESHCLKNGCQEFWTVFPEQGRIRVATRTGIQVYERSDEITCSLFPGWSARIADLLDLT